MGTHIAGKEIEVKQTFPAWEVSCSAEVPGADDLAGIYPFDLLTPFFFSCTEASKCPMYPNHANNRTDMTASPAERKAEQRWQPRIMS